MREINLLVTLYKCNFLQVFKILYNYDRHAYLVTSYAATAFMRCDDMLKVNKYNDCSILKINESFVSDC